MPFKSQAQRRKFYAMANKGEIADATVKHWEDATGDKKLPERVTKKASYLKGTEAALEKLGFTKNASAWNRFMDPMTGAGAAAIRKAPDVMRGPLIAASNTISRVRAGARQVGQRAGLIPPRPPPKFTTTEVSLSELPPDVLANYHKQHGGLAK